MTRMQAHFAMRKACQRTGWLFTFDPVEYADVASYLVHFTELSASCLVWFSLDRYGVCGGLGMTYCATDVEERVMGELRRVLGGRPDVPGVCWYNKEKL